MYQGVKVFVDTETVHAFELIKENFEYVQFRRVHFLHDLADETELEKLDPPSLVTGMYRKMLLSPCRVCASVCVFFARPHTSMVFIREAKSLR